MRRISASRNGATAAAMLALLVGCTHHRIAMAPEPAAPPPARPVLAPELGAVVPPAIGPDGRYQTINRNLGPQQTAWHVRAALNVAAIGCRSMADASLTTAYNSLLATQRASLAKDNVAVQAIYRTRFGKAWQDQHDAYMTRLYNFFAMPVAKAAFCQAADRVAPQAASVPAGSFETFAQTALPELEAPFIAVFQRVADYQVQVAAWDARYGAGAGASPMLLASSAATAPASAVTLALPDPQPALPKIESRKRGKGPALAYENVGALISWTPSRGGTALAER